MIEIVEPNARGIARAASLLRSGEVVAIPTETVYGLAGHALDEGAVARIFAAKERPTFDPLIVHVADFETQGIGPGGIVDAGRLDPSARAVVRILSEAFWPGPLTLVLPRAGRVPDLVSSGLDTVGVRVPAHPVARAVLEASGLPLAAPSANRFGRISPTRAAHVVDELGDRIPMVLDGGEAPVGVESTVLRVEEGGGLTLLRPGGIPVEEIEARAGRMVVRGATPVGAEGAPAPGMLDSHYAPGSPLLLLPGPLAELDDRALARALGEVPGGAQVRLLLQGGSEAALRSAADRVTALSGARVQARSLSAEGDPSEAARALFATLRELDEGPGARVLVAEPADGDTGLRHAINDRLRRAAAPRPLQDPGPTPRGRSGPG
jgi:L-threonylcarbamoyladenylate synthase